ncbi:MAG: PaREP1 family protein [Candidatus Freyarchaeota archaeon]
MSTIILPKAVAQRLEKKAREAGVSLSEYLFTIVTRDLDPNTRAEWYIDGASELLDQAREELGKGDLRQASEKIWGACALSIKAYASFKEGKRLESHGDLWIYKNKVAQDLGEYVKTAFRQADSMHKNFYENLATGEDVEDVAKEVAKLVKDVAAIIKKKKTM